MPRDKHARLRAAMFKQMAPAGTEVLVKLDSGLLTSYAIEADFFLAERFARLIDADTNWFEAIVSHQPTVGAFYEILLRNSLAQLAPLGCEVGTGFVLDPHKKVHGKQIDILTWNSTSSSPIFKS